VKGDLAHVTFFGKGNIVSLLPKSIRGRIEDQAIIVSVPTG
jgi:hypothetical protein